jgi:hypothetical protein
MVMDAAVAIKKKYDGRKRWAMLREILLSVLHV